MADTPSKGPQRRPSDSTPKTRRGWMLDPRRAKRHPFTGALVSAKQELKRDLRALFLEHHPGVAPTPRQLKRFRRQMEAELRTQEQPRTDVLKGGGEAA